MGREAAFFVEFHSGGVAAPDVEGEVVATARFCKVDCGGVESFADALASFFFVYAKVVDIKGLYIGEDGAVLMLLENAEAVAEHTATLLFIDETGAVAVL